jgi:Zn-dependent protease with chaperone function
MSFLLMVFLTLICLFVGEYPQPPWWNSIREPALATTAAVCLVGLHAFWVSRRVSWPLARDPSRRDVLLGRYERWRFLHQIVQIGVYLVSLTLLGWGWAIEQLWTYKHHGQVYSWPGQEIAVLAPFILGQLVTWLFFYDADRAAYRAAHRLLDADPFSQTWVEARQVAPLSFGGRFSYIWFQMRQKLALVFIPVILLIIKNEVSRLFPEAMQGVTNLVAIVGMFATFICMPLLIRLILGLKPLPPGELRDRLLAATNRHKFRCSDILLWNTRSGMANAMVIGLVPWLRYVVFTDRLIEEFPEDEVEAVFGHEVGHMRHYHMQYYLAFMTLSMTVLFLLAEHYLLPGLANVGYLLAETFPSLPALGVLLGPGGKLAAFPVVGVLLAYIFLVFGFLSRQCERQADVFGCKAVSCLDPTCAGHDENSEFPQRGCALCPTGIRTFIRALEKVAEVNGISRERPGFLQSWQHSTIARRVAFLRRILTDPAIEPVFQGRLWWLKTALLVGLWVLLAWLVTNHGWGA